MMCFLDGYSRYNQVLVDEKDQLKIAFIPSGELFLTIACCLGSLMLVQFRGWWILPSKILLVRIYMDDLTIYSKDLRDHLQHLWKIFQRCEVFGISLNPKKCIFKVTKGRWLGYIILEKGIFINPNRVATIQKIIYPSSLKELHSFMGKINFLRKFILVYAKIMKPLMTMMKKDAKIKWSNEAKKDIHDIKVMIIKAWILTSLDYKNPFHLYSFTLDHLVARVLT